MPSDDTRRLLRTFGMAVTDLEDAIANRAPAEKLRQCKAQARSFLQEVSQLVERLSGQADSAE